MADAIVRADGHYAEYSAGKPSSVVVYKGAELVGTWAWRKGKGFGKQLSSGKKRPAPPDSIALLLLRKGL